MKTFVLRTRSSYPAKNTPWSIKCIRTTPEEIRQEMIKELAPALRNGNFDFATCNGSRPLTDCRIEELMKIFHNTNTDFDATNCKLWMDNENGYLEYDISEHEIPETPEKPEWEFKADEEVWDHAGTNMAGILTNGTHFLYWHAFKDEEADPIEKCHIYNSIWMDPNRNMEECVYDWTSENDQRVLDALNSIESFDRICGENGILGTIKFSKATEE